MANIIRAARLRPEHEDFNYETMTIQMLELHNAYLHYIRTLYPQFSPPGTILTIEDERLKAVWMTNQFDPSDKKAKWRIFVKNLLEIDGVPYRGNINRLQQNRAQLAAALPISRSQISFGTPSARIAANVASNNSSNNSREFEPAPLNGPLLHQREQYLRTRFKEMYKEIDNHIKTHFLHRNHSDRPHDPESTAHASTSRKRDTFTLEEPESSSPTPAKKAKVEESDPEELSISDRCIICMEKRRTHAFLHFGLANSDMTSHFVACEDCAKSCRWADQGCPMCRQPCINVVRVLK